MRQGTDNLAAWRAGKPEGTLKGAFHVFKNRRAVVVAGMLLALHMVLAMFLGIYLTQSVKLSVAFITNVVTGYLFGPYMAFVTGALGDILQYILKPVGGYFFGWTLNAAIGGLVYGLAFYRKAPKEGVAGNVKNLAKAAAGGSGQVKRAAFALSDVINGGIFAAMLACWSMLPFLKAPARQYPAINLAKLLANPTSAEISLPQETMSFAQGSALSFLTGRAGECAETSPHTLALVSLILILAGIVFLLCRCRLPVVLLSAAACLWLLLPVYTDRKVLTAKSGFVLICVGFAACALTSLMAVLRAKAMDAGFLLRCFVAMLFVTVIVQMFLGTVWCTVMYGKGFWFYFVPRAIKSLIQLPFNAILAYYTIRAVHRLRIEA